MNTNGDTIANSDLAAVAVLEEQAKKRALADPLPGPLAIAFEPCQEIDVLGKKVRPVVASTWVFLKTINSPLVSIMADVVSTGKIDTEMSDEEAWELCWIFTHSPKEVRELLKQGREALRERALADIGDGEPNYPVNLVMGAISEQLQRHVTTMVKQAAKVQEEGTLNFFRVSQTQRQPEAAAGS